MLSHCPHGFNGHTGLLFGYYRVREHEHHSSPVRDIVPVTSDRFKALPPSLALYRTNRVVVVILMVFLIVHWLMAGLGMSISHSLLVPEPLLTSIRQVS